MDVLESPLFHLLHGPVGGGAVVAAVVDAGAVDFGHPEEIFHHLRVVEGFVLDLGEGAQVNLVASCFLRGGRMRGAEEPRRKRLPA